VAAPTEWEGRASDRDELHRVMTSMLREGALGSGPAPAREPPVIQARVARSSVLISLATVLVLGVGLASLVESHHVAAGLVGGWATLAAPLVAGLVSALLWCERRWPAERRETGERGLAHDACFLILHLALVIPLMTLLAIGFSHLLNDVARGTWRSWSDSVPPWALSLSTLVLMDGGNWLAHWCEHRVDALWRMHALHHSQEELNVLTSFRAHPLSHFMGFLFATIPVVFVMGDRPLAPVLITVHVCLGTFPHANVPWSFGPLGKVVVSPAYHRIHHSNEGMLGVNLGIVLTVWDVMSGRAVFPERREAACPTGIAGRPLTTEQGDRATPHLSLVVEQLVEPFRAQRSASS
jgi:sterol desaturase/sphingolipid hydroxylase (fatty acid hydroxylase superfamily)